MCPIDGFWINERHPKGVFLRTRMNGDNNTPFGTGGWNNVNFYYCSPNVCNISPLFAIVAARIAQRRPRLCSLFDDNKLATTWRRFPFCQHAYFTREWGDHAFKIDKFDCVMIDEKNYIDLLFGSLEDRTMRSFCSMKVIQILH